MTDVLELTADARKVLRSLPASSCQLVARTSLTSGRVFAALRLLRGLDIVEATQPVALTRWRTVYVSRTGNPR